MDLKQLQADLAAGTDAALSKELLEAYDELKSRYFKGDFRPGELEGGRFAESSWRILQLKVAGRFTPIGKTLPDVKQLLVDCEKADPVTTHESIRIHIPKVLAAVYNIRNRRDVGHIAADVSANVMDAEYVVAACSWVLAELVRLFHHCSPEEARGYVEGIVKRRAPLVQVFGDTPFVLKRDLTVREEILLLLYHQGAIGASTGELNEWMPTVKREIIRARLSDLQQDDRFIRRIDGRALITDTGATFVEERVICP